MRPQSNRIGVLIRGGGVTRKHPPLSPPHTHRRRNIVRRQPSSGQKDRLPQKLNFQAFWLLASGTVWKYVSFVYAAQPVTSLLRHLEQTNPQIVGTMKYVTCIFQQTECFQRSSMWWHGPLLHSFFMAEYSSIIQICCILCFHSSIYGHVSSFHLWLL